MKIVALLMVLAITYLTWSWVREDRAITSAREFCDQFKVGTLMADVITAARDEGDMKLRVVTAEHITVGYNGAFPFSHHFCTIEGLGGKVLKQRTFHPD